MVVMKLLFNAHHIREIRWISGVSIMPTTYARWILGISIRFGDNLSKMCPFVDFNRSKLGNCTNLQKKYCIGEAIFLVRMGLLKSTTVESKSFYWEWSFYVITTISARWILGICLRFGNILSKMG